MRKIKLKKTKPIVTAEWFSSYIKHAKRSSVTTMVGRALVHLYKLQTDSEKLTGSTCESNGAGFSSYDAQSGTRAAQYFIDHGTLDPFMFHMWIQRNKKGVPRIAKYHKQLNEIAVNKQKQAYLRAKGIIE